MAGPHTLAETERTAQSRLKGMRIDYEALAVTSNLFRTANIMRNHLEREVLAPADLTWTAFVVLWIAWIWGGAETRIIAEESGVSKATLSGVLNTLEKREFIVRRVGEQDKRLVTVHLTPAGTRLIKRLFPLINEQERFICRKLAFYLVSDEPPASLVESMAQVFRTTDGDIAAVLRTLFASREFVESLGRKFKDPLHYVLSAVRLAYDDKVILNAGPIVNWLNRMGEPLYGRQTPDGYPLVQSAWASPGQMTTRFEIARAVGSGSAGLFKSAGPQPVERAAFPQLANALYYKSLEAMLSNDTRGALAQANSPQEWNTYLLSSPEFMYR